MISAEEFEKATGHKPENDDLERVNCPRFGELGHSMCGWNTRLNMPYFMVGEFDAVRDGRIRDEP